jgi:hypothetical protein
MDRQNGNRRQPHNSFRHITKYQVSETPSTMSHHQDEIHIQSLDNGTNTVTGNAGLNEQARISTVELAGRHRSMHIDQGFKQVG